MELANSGWTAVEAQRYGEALRAFSAAVVHLRNEPTVWLGRGLAEFMLGRDPRLLDSDKTRLGVRS